MLRRVFSILLLVIFLIWLFFYVYFNTEKFLVISTVAASDVLILASAFVVILVCSGMFISVISRKFNVYLGITEWLSLSFASSFANYFLPFKGGMGLRALYMSKFHDFPLTEFVTTLSVMYLMHFVVNSLLALVGMQMISMNGGITSATLYIFFASILLISVFIMKCKVNINTTYKDFPMKQLYQLVNAWRKVHEDRILVLKLWGLMLCMTMATVIQCKVAFSSISIQLSWGGIFVYAASKNLAMLVGLTPGSLGIVEMISVYLGNILGYSTSEALLVQALIRSVAIGILLIFGSLAFYLLQQNIRSARQKCPT